jgi:hypothetical protein
VGPSVPADLASQPRGGPASLLVPSGSFVQVSPLSLASSMTVTPGTTLLSDCLATGLSSIQLQAQPSGLEFS